MTAVSFSGVLAEQAARRPDATAVVDRERRVTYGWLDGLVARVAGGLQEMDVGAGDVVSSQLPNWLESVVLALAANRLGAVHNPLSPILGARELRFVLGQAQSVVLVVPERFRGVDHATVAARLRPELPALREVVVLAGDDDLALLGSGTSAPVGARVDDEREATFLLYTSGTTADPKGVLHSDATLLAEGTAMARHYGLTPDDVFVMPSPVSHVSGLLYGVLIPVLVGGTAVLMDVWDPTQFLELVQREGGTFSAGATPFLQGVADHPDLDRFDHSSLRLFPCGGANVPPDLIRRAIARLGVRTGRGYGSTEMPSATSSAGADDPDEKRAETDGRPIAANQVQVRDGAGRDLPTGQEGEIWVNGPERFLGYRDPDLDAGVFDGEGFFRTGDLGVLDGDGYLTVTGRLKDVVVRSGEKLSAKEIEDLLFEHPKVQAVAVVPVADPDVGERACAVVVPRQPADPPTLEELNAFLAAKELSRRKLPERLAVVDQLPTTASGKVQKHLLAEHVTAMLGAQEGVRP